MPTERDGVRISRGDRGFRRCAVKTAGGDQHAAPQRAEQLHCRGHVLVVDLGAAGAAASRLDEVQIGKTERIQHGVALTPYNRATFYGGEAVGYTDYPVHDDLQEASHDKHAL